jgi:hypothetical protein
MISEFSKTKNDAKN